MDQALERVHAARARAEAAPEPAPRQAVCWLEAMCQVAMGYAEGVADAAERLARLQAEYDAPEGKAAVLWFRGWAEAHLGDPRAGHRLIREGCEQASRIGMRAFAGETLGYAAEASMLAGDWSAARLELLGCTALCEREDATREELDALGRVVDRLTEGLDTPPVARARALLARPVRALP